MPHFKCVTCRIRVHRAGAPADLCPGCGSAFEPAGALAELVGFRAVASRERRVDDGDSQIAQAVALPRPETTC